LGYNGNCALIYGSNPPFNFFCQSNEITQSGGSQITCPFPIGTAGSNTAPGFKLLCPHAISTAAFGGITYASKPTIAGISISDTSIYTPTTCNSGSPPYTYCNVNSGATLSILGNYFVTAQPGLTVSTGAIGAPSVTPNQITVTLPNGAAGTTVSVTVTTAVINKNKTTNLFFLFIYFCCSFCVGWYIRY
jgi:hypothetical protein